MQGVTTRLPLRGRAEVLPRMILQAKGDSSFAVASSDVTKLANFLITPVIEINKKAKSKQELREGWDRVLKKIDFSETIPGDKPLLVSARNNWTLYQGDINIIENAYVIDGAKYLEYLLHNDTSLYIPIVVIFNRSEEQELLIRNKINGGTTFSINDIKNKVGTDAPRLTINEFWREIEIVSDPFVIKTSIGYTAAINVIELKTNSIYHIIIGAKSVSNELEIIRNKFGSLANIKMKIRKQSSDPKSIYEIKI